MYVYYIVCCFQYINNKLFVDYLRIITVLAVYQRLGIYHKDTVGFEIVLKQANNYKYNEIKL